MVYVKDVFFSKKEIDSKLSVQAASTTINTLQTEMTSSAPELLILPTPQQLRYLFSVAAHFSSLAPEPGKFTSLSQRSLASQIHNIFYFILNVLQISPSPQTINSSVNKSDSLILDTSQIKRDKSLLATLNEYVSPDWILLAFVDISLEKYVPTFWKTFPTRDAFRSKKNTESASSSASLANATTLGRPQRAAAKRGRETIDELYAKFPVPGSGNSNSNSSTKAKQQQNKALFNSIETTIQKIEDRISGKTTSSSNDDEFEEMDDEELENVYNVDPKDFHKYRYQPKYVLPEYTSSNQEENSESIKNKTLSDYIASVADGGSSSSDSTKSGTGEYFLNPENLIFSSVNRSDSTFAFLGWILQYDTPTEPLTLVPDYVPTTSSRSQRFQQLSPLLDIVLTILEYNIKQHYIVAKNKAKASVPLTTSLTANAADKTFDSLLFRHWIWESSKTVRTISSIILVTAHSIRPETILQFSNYLPDDEIFELQVRNLERACIDDEDFFGNVLAEKNETLSPTLKERIKLLKTRNEKEVSQENDTPDTVPPSKLIQFKESVSARLRLVHIVKAAMQNESEWQLFYTNLGVKMMRNFTADTFELVFYKNWALIPVDLLSYVCKTVLGDFIELVDDNNNDRPSSSSSSSSTSIYSWMDEPKNLSIEMKHVIKILGKEPSKLIRSDKVYTLQAYLVLIKTLLAIASKNRMFVDSMTKLLATTHKSGRKNRLDWLSKPISTSNIKPATIIPNKAEVDTINRLEDEIQMIYLF